METPGAADAGDGSASEGAGEAVGEEPAEDAGSSGCEAAGNGGGEGAEPVTAGEAVVTAAIRVSPLSTAALRAVCVLNPMTVWVVGEGGAAFKTSDGGLTWTPCAGSAPSLYGLAPMGARALAGGNNGTTLLLP